MSPLLNNLIRALQYLPGVGPKSATRMALHLLQKSRGRAWELKTCIEEALNKIDYCKSCNMLSESPLCRICSDSRRDQSILCVIEKIQDLMAIEATRSFYGLYFVLQGSLSAIDGRGPNEIGVPKLLDNIKSRMLTEVVVATSTTVDGEATAYFLSETLKKQGLKVTRIAYGVPVGGELDYLDINTVSRAMACRVPVES